MAGSDEGREARPSAPQARLAGIPIFRSVALCRRGWLPLKSDILRVSVSVKLGFERSKEWHGRIICRADHRDVAGGGSPALICRGLGISEQIYHRWRREDGGLTVTQAARLKALEKENARLRKAASNLTLDASILKRGRAGKVLSPSRRHDGAAHKRAGLGVSERRACRVIGQHRSTQRRRSQPCSDENRLTADIVRLASIYGRYGHRRIAALLQLLCTLPTAQRRLSRPATCRKRNFPASILPSGLAR